MTERQLYLLIVVILLAYCMYTSPAERDADLKRNRVKNLNK